ncbi:MAG: DUF4097 family beta strand repeat-containing protein [Aeromicrobium sp.]
MTDEQTIADYDVRSPASRTLLTVLGTILVVAVLGGLVLGASILKRDTTVSTSVVELGQSRLVVIDAGTADLRIVQGEPEVVKVSARITSGLRKTDFQIGRRDDEIKILSGCQTWLSPGCGVSATLEIPEGLPVVIRTTSGNVVAQSISEGALTVVTGAGNVSTEALSVDELEVTTTSGDVAADFARQPFGIKATTDSGDITAGVPLGDRSYTVTARSKSGQVTSSIPSKGGEQGYFVRARSSSGDIDLSMK